MKHRHRRYCWARLRLHRWRGEWLNGEKVADVDGASYGCVECGAMMG